MAPLSHLAISILATTAVAVPTQLAPRQSKWDEEPPIWECIPRGCVGIESNALVCQDGEQHCAFPDDDQLHPLGTPCKNETVSLEYPITADCPSPLAPYDPSKIEDGCAKTGDCVIMWMSSGPALWVMCSVSTGKGGMSYHFTGMECPRDENEEEEEEDSVLQKEG